VPNPTLHEAKRLLDKAVLPALFDYTRIPCLSPSFDRSWAESGHIDQAVALLASYARAHLPESATVSIERLAGRTPLLFIDVMAEGGGSPDDVTLFYGHCDKQPPLGDWQEGRGPFSPVIEGDRLYGRGTADDGYALFAAISVLEILRSEGRSHGRCIICIEASEESGSVDLEAHLAALAGRISRPRLVVCLDSGCATYDRIWTTTSLRGNCVVRLGVRVLDYGVHSGAAGGIVPSSFRILRQLLDRIEDSATGRLLLRELNVEIPPARVAEAEALAGELPGQLSAHLPVRPGLQLSGTDESERLLNQTWRPCLAVTGIDGVPAIAAGGNVLLPYTEVKLSLRLPPTCDANRAAEAVRAACVTDPPDGAEVSCVIEDAAPGWDAPGLSDELRRSLDEASTTHFGRPASSMGEGGTIPFMATLASRYPEAELLATGVLGPKSNAHGPDEFLHLPTFTALVATLADVLAGRSSKAR